MLNPMDEYAKKLQEMTDEELEREWQEEEGYHLQKVKHEMAMRFRRKSFRQQTKTEELTNEQSKFLQMISEFREAYEKKNWFAVKFIWDSLLRIGSFIELTPEIRKLIFGGYDTEDNSTATELMEMAHKAIAECAIKDNLGFECVVYRVPGEIGFSGAKYMSGTKIMPAEENPTYRTIKNT